MSRTLRAVFCALALAVALPRPLSAATAPAPVAFVPLDDRPVTLQLPLLLGHIAGRAVLAPPVALLGHYLTPGDPDGILRWLSSDATRPANALVVSLDMVAYGGLVASRVPGVPTYVAYTRLRQLAQLRADRPGLGIVAFGTIMRLAPTGVPATTPYWANGDVVDRIAEYASLPSPTRTADERARAAHLRALIGPKTLDAYLATRARNRDVDQFALQLAAEGTFDEIVLGQDDAGPAGLHVADVAAVEPDEPALRARGARLDRARRGRTRDGAARARVRAGDRLETGRARALLARGRGERRRPARVRSDRRRRSAS